MHKYLTWTEHIKIEKGLKEGLKPCAIADRLHVNNTTIYRELKRGRYTRLNSDLTTEERCSAEIAEQRQRENLKAKGGELKIGEESYSATGVVTALNKIERRFGKKFSQIFKSITFDNGSEFMN